MILSSEGADRATARGQAQGRARARAVAASVGAGSPSQVYSTIFTGFAADLPADAIAALQRNPKVEAIEDDFTVSLVDPVRPGAAGEWRRSMLAKGGKGGGGGGGGGGDSGSLPGECYNPDGSPVCGPGSVLSPPEEAICIVTGNKRNRTVTCDCIDETTYWSDTDSACVAYPDACDPSPCDANATCDSFQGEATCACQDGYFGDGQTCTLLVNECDPQPGPCGGNATCTDTDESYYCTCNSGFAKDANGDCVEAPQTDEVPWGISHVNGGYNLVGAAQNRVFVLDTGIQYSNPDLNLNTSLAWTNYVTSAPGGGADDDGDHGTHVAGTIGAMANGVGLLGVAPGVELVPVKVLSGTGSGSYAGILAALDHVATVGADMDVINMSLGGGAYSTLDQKIQGMSTGATTSGKRFQFAISAGNDDSDAANYSPARANTSTASAYPNIWTVSATINDATGGLDCLAYFSNWGATVDIGAPGYPIKSYVPSLSNPLYTESWGGTSMAAPHVAGLLAVGWGAQVAAGTHLPGASPVRGSGCGVYGQNDPDSVREPVARWGVSTGAALGAASAQVAQAAPASQGVGLAAIGFAAGGVVLVAAVAGTAIVVVRRRRGAAAPARVHSEKSLDVPAVGSDETAVTALEV